jgi:hypothetical protein
VTHTEKKKVIERLVVVPKEQKRHFWSREIKSLNILLDSYPSDFFWQNLSFSDKVNSIIVFRSGYYKEEIIKKYRRFNYKIPPPNNISLGEKSGKDYDDKNKPKNLRDFLA